jgi:hypothetical protein
VACFKLKELHLVAISLQSLMAGELLVALTFNLSTDNAWRQLNFKMEI